MRAAVILSLALALYACGRSEPGALADASVEETQQVEQSADAGRPLSDASLTQIVKSALHSESSIDSRRIDVENKSGRVTLNGWVDSDAQKQKAGRIAESVGGVTTVVNNLVVEPSASTGASAPGSVDGTSRLADTPKPWEKPPPE